MCTHYKLRPNNVSVAGVYNRFNSIAKNIAIIIPKLNNHYSCCYLRLLSLRASLLPSDLRVHKNINYTCISMIESSVCNCLVLIPIPSLTLFSILHYIILYCIVLYCTVVLWYIILHRESKKEDTIFLSNGSLLNIDRFLQFFHRRTQLEICNKTINKDSTSPQMCCYTTL